MVLSLLVQYDIHIIWIKNSNYVVDFITFSRIFFTYPDISLEENLADHIHVHL